MSLTVLEDDVCALFDLMGSSTEVVTKIYELTEGSVPADTIHLIFKPNKDFNQMDGIGTVHQEFRFEHWM